MTHTEISPDAGTLATSVASALLTRLSDLQSGGREPHLVLTGGTIAERVHRETARLAPDSPVDWTRVVVWWGDERFVDPDSEDRNALAARRDLLDPVGATQVHEMPSTSDADDPEEAARIYSDLVRSSGGGRFDLVMLGMGPDGHVASLMPHHAALDVDDRIAVGVRHSPKPPPERVSLTFPALNRTEAVWFMVSGRQKADAVARATAAEGDLHDTPARGITVPDRTWWLDGAAASRI